MKRVSLIPALFMCAACFASPAHRFHAAFGHWNADAWQLVREPRFPAIGRWVQAPGDPDAIQNYAPSGTSDADLTAAKNGVGVVQMMVKDARMADFDCVAATAFEGKGAPSIMFHAKQEGNVTPEMSCVVIYEKGINVWKLTGGKWSKVAAAEFAVSAGQYHRLGVRVRGSSIAVLVDGKAMVHATDPIIAQSGAIGIWGGEGICRFRSFDLRY